MSFSSSRVNTLVRFLDRTGRMWIGAPLRLGGFTVRFVRGLPLTLADIGSPAVGGLLYDNVAATVIATVRGLGATIVFGIVSALIAGAMRRALGAFSEPAFESTALPWIFSGALPLTLALLAVARAGAEITAEYAMHGGDDGGADAEHTLQRTMIPQIVSTGLSRAIFFMIVAVITMYGYLGQWSLSMVPRFHGWEVIALAHRVQSPLIKGFVASGVFGALAAYVSAAFGVMTRDDIARGVLVDPPQEAFWQSASTSTSLCIIITLCIWATL